MPTEEVFSYDQKNRKSETDTGVDLITNAVRAALGEEIVDVEQKPYDGHWAEIILHSETPGTFDKLWVSDEIKENIIENDLWIESGDSVGGFSGANEAIGTLVLRFDTHENMQKVLENQNDFVKVLLK